MMNLRTDHVDQSSRRRARRAAADIRAEIERRIESGLLEPGAQIPTERELAAQFSASRATVRNALNGLVEAGRISRQVGRGSFVSPEDVRVPIAFELLRNAGPRQVFEFRSLIEPSLVDLVFLNASQSEIDAILECVEQGDSAKTAADFNFWDGQFHRRIALATHNPIIIAIYEAFNVARKSQSWMRMKQQAMDRSKWEVFQSQHRAIAMALKDGDHEAAYRAAAEHVEQARSKLLGV